MSRLVSRAESWEKAYTAFQNINFSAFDYNTVKQSLIDYVKLFFPETFNDYIESSEFIAIVETFAYIAELTAYRLDLNAHENFITNAQRRDSILRLAKLVSYKADRPLPARGLVKIVSISTTEDVFDANGINLANRTIRWNDSTNPSWKEQFILVLNRVLEQEFGTVSPSDRFQIQDVLFELYALNLAPPLPLGVFTYSVLANNRSVSMELVPSAYDETSGFSERRPQNNANFTILYGSDGFGDSSETTGFFCFTKQGQLQRFRTTFDGVTPNQTFEVPTTNINETDVWLNQVNPETGETINESPLLPFHRPSSTKSGEWVQVDLARAQNVIFNTVPSRNKYEVETLTGDSINLVFGDGEFSDIPSGTFDIWVRSSANEDLVIEQTSVVNTPISFTYLDSLGRTQTFSFAISLIGSLQNASAAETIEHIRTTAPSVYYTQDRMVNAEDYNVFMLQDSSILKLRAVNRTFAGESKYIAWHDPSKNYENVKLFSDDGIIYFQEINVNSSTDGEVSINELMITYLEPVLSSTDLFIQLVSNGVDPSNIRRFFNNDETIRIETALTPPPTPVVVELYYNRDNNEWYAVKQGIDPNVFFGVADYIGPYITITQTSVSEESYTVTRLARRIIVQSQTTQFWNNNDGNAIIEVDTLNSDLDLIVLLKANMTSDRDGIFAQNWNFNVLGREVIDSGPQLGLNDIHRISVIPTDENGDRIPDNLDLSGIINASIKITPTAGYQVINIGGNIVESNPTGLALATVYTSTITVDGNPIIVSVDGTDAQTYADLIDKINTTLGSAASVSLIDGNLRIVSATTGSVSTVLIVDGILALFASLTDFIALDTPVAGTPTLPYTAILPIYYITNVSGDVYTTSSTPLTKGVDWEVPGAPASLTVPNIENTVIFSNFQGNTSITLTVKDYVYFNRLSKDDPWVPAETSFETINSYIDNQINQTNFWKRENGRDLLNFAWFHRTPRLNLIDPSATNIIDMFIITKGYYDALRRWLDDPLFPQPDLPTPLSLRTSYQYLLNNKMISDTVILHPGRIKLLFGTRARPELQATLKIIPSENKTLTDNQIKTTVVSVVRNFFDLSKWEFGETFYFTELATAIHATLPTEISSVVIVPEYENNQFGDMFVVQSAEDEIFYPDITVNDIDIVPAYTSINLRLDG